MTDTPPGVENLMQIVTEALNEAYRAGQLAMQNRAATACASSINQYHARKRIEALKLEDRPA